MYRWIISLQRYIHIQLHKNTYSGNVAVEEVQSIIVAIAGSECIANIGGLIHKGNAVHSSRGGEISRCLCGHSDALLILRREIQGDLIYDWHIVIETLGGDCGVSSAAHSIRLSQHAEYAIVSVSLDGVCKWCGLVS